MYKKKFTAKDGTEVLFREPKITDAKLAMEFINPFVDEKNSGLSINKKVILKQERVWIQNLLKEIRKKEHVTLFVFYNNKIVGNCHIERKRWKHHHKAYLGIALSKDIRNKGIGFVVAKETINLAKKRMKGLEILETSVFGYNKRAQHFYKKLGFKRVATMPKSAKEGKRYTDEHFMQIYFK